MRHDRRRLSHMLCLAVGSLALAGTACVPWTVITQKDPSVLVGATAIAVNWDFSQTKISSDNMTEQQWQDSREKPEDWNTYLETKQKAQEGYLAKLSEKVGGGVQVSSGTAPAGGVQVTYQVDWWEEGAYIGVAAWPSQIQGKVQVSKDGTVTDVVAINCRVEAGMMTPSPQQRHHRCGEILGELTAKFVQSRAG